MNNIFKLFIYYILILFGLIIVSWIIWSRFIRERIIREIPDGTFTEYRFWILLYICIIYLYIIKNHIKPKEPNAFFIWLSDIFFTPQKKLDHLIKYNIHTKNYYYNIIERTFIYLAKKSNLYYINAFYSLQIFPRIILILFLVLDTFYFNKIEIFYKVILIGIIPFLFRYFLYSINDFYNQMIESLESIYDYVEIYEKGYEGLISRKRDTSAEYHLTHVTIKEYIEIKYYNMLQNEFEENFPYEYVASPYPKAEVYLKYKLNKYNTIEKTLTKKDFSEIDALFVELIPKILEYKTIIDSINKVKEHLSLKWFRITMFTLYLICWSFILTISYWTYPVEFYLFKYFCNNMALYLTLPDDQFSLLYGYSVNENCFTMEKLKYLLKKIYEVIQND